MLPALFNEELSLENNAINKEEAIRERVDFLLKHNIALWDVINSCKIHGASDSSIKNVIPNDFTSILQNAQIHNVFFTGKKAFSLWQKYCNVKYQELYKLKCVCLPSTSPANARQTLPMLIASYRIIAESLSYMHHAPAPNNF